MSKLQNFIAEGILTQESHKHYTRFSGFQVLLLAVKM